MKPSEVAAELYGDVEDLDTLGVGVIESKSKSGKVRHSFFFFEKGLYDVQVDVYGVSFITFSIGTPWMMGARVPLPPYKMVQARTAILDILSHNLSNIYDGRFVSEEAYLEATKKP